MINTLVEFLNARINEEEQTAQAAAENAGGAQWIGTMESGNPWRYSDGQGVYTWCEDGVESDRPLVAAVQWEKIQDHIARHDPARVLADIAAKRAIVDAAYHAEHWLNMRTLVEPMRTEAEGRAKAFAFVLRLLAQPYADHADFRPEWAPQNA